jgi:hypothetical protein
MQEDRLNPALPGQYRQVNRGTTWYNGPHGARATGRGFDVTAVRSKNLSIRLARSNVEEPCKKTD